MGKQTDIHRKWHGDRYGETDKIDRNRDTKNEIKNAKDKKTNKNRDTKIEIKKAKDKKTDRQKKTESETKTNKKGRKR